ncbi:MAG: sugar porter family MFS transporter [Prolixibacteraceae bacterium]
MKIYLVLACFVAATGGFLFGFDTSVISGAIEYLQAPSVFNLNEFQKGWAVGCILIGCMVGCVFAGPFSYKYGRKKSLLFSAVLFFISAVGCALSNSYQVFNIYRMIGGVAVGAASMLAPIYIAEISPAKHRGKLLTLNLFAIFLGQSAAFYTNYLLKDVGGIDNWRYMIGVEAIPAFILFVLLFFIPESPRWLLESHKSGLALRILKKLNNEEVAITEFAEIQDSISRSEKKKLIELFSGKIFKVLLIGCALAIFQQITGINIIMYFAPSIFKAAGFSQDSALFQTAIMGTVNLTFSVLAMVFVDKVGRKPLMIIGSIGMGISLVLLSLTFILDLTHGYLVLFCIMGFLASFGFSLGPIVWVLIPEIFPNHYRSMGVAVSIFIMWGANFLVSYTFPILLKNLEGYAFFIYAAMCFLCLIFVIKYLKETKGKSLEQIEIEFIG